jgi:VWFA-related protein
MRVLVLIICFISTAGAQFRSTSTLVLAPVTVTGPTGKYIDGLRAKDLILYDNNVPQPIQVEEAFNPLSLIVAIQSSANASANLHKLSDTGILFTHVVAGERGLTSLISFADDARVLSDFTASPDRLKQQLRGMVVRGKGSAVLDTVMDALTTLSNRPHESRRVLLVIGEARDRSSKTRIETVAQAAQRQNVLIYWLTYSPFLSALTAPAGSPPPPGNLLNVFTEVGQQSKGDAAALLTSVTGGRVIKYLQKDSMEEAIQAIGAEIHRQYLVSFQPQPAAAGQYHSIRIEVKGRPELTARTRAGYWTVQ